MANYRLEVNGQNFLLDMEGRRSKFGFFTSRFVEASDPISAENAAVQMIRETQRLRDMIHNDANDRPVMVVTEMIELESFGDIENREPGFVWYEEHAKRWWQFWKR